MKTTKRWGPIPLPAASVIEADRIDVDAIASFASSQGLFELDRKKPEREPLFRKVTNPVSCFECGLSTRFPAGISTFRDSYSWCFWASALPELIRGNFRTPPWIYRLLVRIRSFQQIVNRQKVTTGSASADT